MAPMTDATKRNALYTLTGVAAITAIANIAADGSVMSFLAIIAAGTITGMLASTYDGIAQPDYDKKCPVHGDSYVFCDCDEETKYSEATGNAVTDAARTAAYDAARRSVRDADGNS